jgi:hypothetical protein
MLPLVDDPTVLTPLPSIELVIATYFSNHVQGSRKGSLGPGLEPGHFLLPGECFG